MFRTMVLDTALSMSLACAGHAQTAGSEVQRDVNRNCRVKHNAGLR